MQPKKTVSVTENIELHAGNVHKLKNLFLIQEKKSISNMIMAQELAELKENESESRSGLTSFENTSDFMSESSGSEESLGPVRTKPANYANPFANQIKFLENAAFENEQKEREQKREE